MPRIARRHAGDCRRGAHRQLWRVGAAHDDGARAPQVGDERRVVGAMTPWNAGSRWRRLPPLIDVFLDRHRNAVERPRAAPARVPHPRGARRPGLLGVVVHDRIERSVLARMRRRRMHHLAARECLPADSSAISTALRCHNSCMVHPPIVVRSSRCGLVIGASAPQILSPVVSAPRDASIWPPVEMSDSRTSDRGGYRGTRSSG